LEDEKSSEYSDHLMFKYQVSIDSKKFTA